MAQDTGRKPSPTILRLPRVATRPGRLSREWPAAAARFVRCRDNDEAAALLHEVLMSLEIELDRELVWGRVQGRSYAQIACGSGQTETVLRSRWVRICRRLN